LQSSETTQFEQHLRAILGLELGGVKLIHPTVMFNILGSKDFEGEYRPIEISEQNVYLKMYGKKISKPLRKLGHMNLVAEESESIEELLQKLVPIKDKARITALN
jgi:5-(carboxyamino)imidazole ribonucleotide synthase